MSPNVNILNTVLVSLAVYFIWMDFGLFVNLSQLPPRQPSKPSKPSLIGNGSLRAHREQQVQYSPFHPMTIKLLLQGPTTHYLDTPMGFWTVHYTPVSQYLSANAVSILGVFCAAIAAKCISTPNLKIRQLGVIVFKVRDYLDALDGFVARQNKHEDKMVPEPGTSGYLFDGACDALGDIFLLLAICHYVYRCSPEFGMSKLPTSSSSSSSSSTSLASSTKESLITMTMSWINPILPTVFLVGMQALVSSLMWNYFMFNYHVLLDSDTFVSSQAQLLMQNYVFKSSGLWMVAYCWRMFNPHSLTQIILLSVLYNRSFEYMTSVKHIGFAVIFAVSLTSHLYYQYAYYVVINA